MKLQVEYIGGGTKRISTFNYLLSLPCFLKHAAIAGQGNELGLLPSLSRGLGTLMLYGRYFEWSWHFFGF